MALHFFCEEIDFVLKNKIKHRNWLKEVCIRENKVVGNINYVFCSDEYVLEINKKYLNHDYFTDIITFDYCINNQLNGDIFISVDSVRNNSNAFNCTFQEEVDRVIVHGVLHLIGYKDDNENNKLVMRNMENFYLKILYSNFLIN